jgi:adenylate cyclase
LSIGDQTRVARAKRFLSWGASLAGAFLLPLASPVEETLGLGLLFKWRGAAAPPADVALIAIDENSEEALEGPISRSMHAELVDALSQGGASVIVFDIFFHTESDDDAKLANAIGRAGNVVLTARLERDSRGGMDRQMLRTPVPTLAGSAVGTASWLVPRVFRVDWAMLRDDADRPTVPLVALQTHVFDEFMALLRAVRPDVGARFPSTKAELHGRDLVGLMQELGRAFAADPALGSDMLAAGGAQVRGLRALIGTYERDRAYRTNRLYLNYYGPPRTVTTLPFQDALRGRLGHDDSSVAGKAVFVGYSARRQPGQRDDYPFVYTTNGFNLSGVEMGATAFANLLHDKHLELPALSHRAALVLLWGLVIAACFRRLRVRPGIAAGVLLFACYLYAALLAFRLGNIWLPIVVPAIQLLFAGTLSVRVKQLEERAQLGIGTSEEALLALTGRGKAEKIDHRVILFADERGSKKRLRRTLTELDAVQSRALQRDFALARDVPVAAHGGRINHTLGDSMLAHWVTRDPSDALDVANQLAAACRAALTIHAGIEALNRKYPGFDLAVRVGLDWGEISSRLNPSPEIKDWRMEGAAIHAAERLESLNKLFGTSTLISHAVASHVESEEFECVELGTFIFCDDGGDIVVDALTVHELRSAEAAVAQDIEGKARFHEALDLLRRGGWHAAATRFDQAAASWPRHRWLATRYADWCRQTAVESNTRWRGVVMVTFSDKSQYLDRFL